MTPSQYEKKLKTAQAVAARCAEATVPAPKWVQMFLAREGTWNNFFVGLKLVDAP